MCKDIFRKWNLKHTLDVNKKFRSKNSNSLRCLNICGQYMFDTNLAGNSFNVTILQKMFSFLISL